MLFNFLRNSVILYICIHGITPFIVRSYITPGTKCNQTAATACFVELFGMIDNICMRKDISLKCVHYSFLDNCFSSRVGKCDSGILGSTGTEGLKIAEKSCEMKNHLKKMELINYVSQPTRNPLSSPLGIVTVLGHLQTQCVNSKSKNCSSEHVNNILDNCEENMKPQAGFAQYDRHKLLRIKLEASRRLMVYTETDMELECLIVRSALSDMYSLHHTHCHHSLVTRCLCEHMHFNTLCGIDCDKLEANTPLLNRLVWENWKDARLVRSSKQYSSSIIIILAIISILHTAGFLN